MHRSRQKRIISAFAIALYSISSIGLAERLEKQGMAIDFSLQPVSSQQANDHLTVGSDAIATFKISDARTGQPISGMRPRAWITARHSEMVANEMECTDKVRSLASGNLAKQADIDLNGYRVLTLNHDKTITIINPLLSFNSTKLENIIVLPANGADWVLSKDRNFLYVTLPEASAVAVIDTTTRKLLTTVTMGEKTIPRHIAIQPDGRYVWVGFDDADQVIALDTVTHQIAAKIPVGKGRHKITFTADNRFAYFISSLANTVTAIDIRTLTKIADIKTEPTPVAIAYGPASKLVYIATPNSDGINVLDPDTQQMVSKITGVSPGIVALAFEPNGRYLFAVNQRTNTVHAIDSATHTIVASTPVVTEPDQITFSDRYAYVRGLGAEKFSLVDLTGLRNNSITSLDIQAGRLAPSEASDHIGVADMIAPTPGGNAVLIANAPDRTLYYYQEGMMAPMGTFSNYKRIPLAIKILDRSLAETSPGVYTAPIKLSKSGRFDVPLLIDQPRVINCFQTSVAEPLGAKNPVVGIPLKIEPLFNDRRYVPNQPQTFRFKITDTTNNQPMPQLNDVQALVVERPGLWQQRRRLQEIEEGVYTFEQAFPHAGSYTVMLQIPSKGVRYPDLPPMVFTVSPADVSNEKSLANIPN